MYTITLTLKRIQEWKEAPSSHQFLPLPMCVPCGLETIKNTEETNTWASHSYVAQFTVNGNVPKC